MIGLSVILLIVAGLGVLALGAELLVRGASRLAGALGVTPLVIGLAFGTSAPELAVSVQAALADRPDVVVGNVVGSNILNVLFILGISSLLTPLVVAQRLVRLEVPIMIGVSVLLLVLALDGRVERLEGLLLVGGIVAYTVFAVRQSRREGVEVRAEYAHEYGPTAPQAQVTLTGMYYPVPGALAAG